MDKVVEANVNLAAANDVLNLDVRGASVLAIQVVGTMSATLQIEGTIDGQTWFALNAIPFNSATAVTSITAAGAWFANVSGLLAARIRCSAYTSGTPLITLRSIEDGLINPAGVAATGAAAGDVASGSTDSGNPVKIGGIAKTSTPTAVSDGQRVNALFSKTGKQIVEGNLRENKVVEQTALSNTTVETTIAAAGGSGVFKDLYGLILANTGATSTKVTIRDDTAGTIRAILYVPAGETRGFMLPDDSGIPQAVANKPWTAQCASATTAMEVTALTAKNV